MTDHKFAHKKKNSVKKFKLQMYRNEGCSGFTLTHPEYTNTSSCEKRISAQKLHKVSKITFVCTC